MFTKGTWSSIIGIIFEIAIMKVRLLSDLHFEFAPKYHNFHQLPVMEGESDMVLVLSGDIMPAQHLVERDANQLLVDNFEKFLQHCCDRHRRVIWVLGNHEHYGYDFPQTANVIKEFCQRFVNLSVLEKETIVVDDVAFIGATLWTDFDDANPQTMWHCRRRMMDYRYIRNSEAPDYLDITKVKFLAPDEVLADHYKAKHFIFEEIAKFKAIGMKTVVVSHHAPSALSVHEIYINDPANGGYLSDFSEMFLDGKGPNAWCHGHMHTSSQYSLGDTWVYANPHGIGNENAAVNHEPDAQVFDYNFFFEV